MESTNNRFPSRFTESLESFDGVSIYTRQFVCFLNSSYILYYLLFLQHFPFLKRLEIVGQSELTNAPQILSATLPFVRAVTCLMVIWEKYKFQTVDQFSGILQLSRLEELHLEVELVKKNLETAKASGDNFFAQLRTCCPKLRVVTICK